jgi:hypothetical protein
MNFLILVTIFVSLTDNVIFWKVYVRRFSVMHINVRVYSYYEVLPRIQEICP